MQTTENTKRKYFTKEQKRKILDELRTHGMTISVLARRHDIHPVTVHKWKREMGSSKNNTSETPDVSELLEEIERIKTENDNLKKAVGEISLDNQVLKTMNDILKKNQRSEQFKSPKKRSKK